MTVPAPRQPDPHTIRHPAITEVGVVHKHGDQVIVSGWHLAPCPTRCRCHHHPLTERLHIATDDGTGHLGLAKFRPPDCTCCTPWTIDELRQILLDVYDFATLVTT